MYVFVPLSVVLTGEYTEAVRFYGQNCARIAMAQSRDER